MVIKLTVVIIEAYHCYKLHIKCYKTFFSLSRYSNEIIGDHQCGFQRNRPTTDQVLCICQVLEKKWEYNGTVDYIFIDFKKAYNSVRKELLYTVKLDVTDVTKSRL
jgi:hypothetical protein